jgi:hypothetical protein
MARVIVTHRHLLRPVVVVVVVAAAVVAPLIRLLPVVVVAVVAVTVARAKVLLGAKAGGSPKRRKGGPCLQALEKSESSMWREPRPKQQEQQGQELVVLVKFRICLRG